MSAAASTSATTAACAAGKRSHWFDKKAHVADIDIDSLDTLKQGFVQAKCEAASFKGSVLVIWLIQSQGKTWTASTAWGEEDADARFWTVREKRLEFALCASREVDHRFLL